jgi:hypothetical protein
MNNRSMDLAHLERSFDVVFDTACSMSPNSGMKHLKPRGVFLDIHPTPVKFLRSVFDRRLKVIICAATTQNLDAIARAAESGKLRIAVGKTVRLEDSIALITALEVGRLSFGLRNAAGFSVWLDQMLGCGLRCGWKAIAETCVSATARKRSLFHPRYTQRK